MDLYDQQVAVLVPGVVFTPTGSRYGYGKGFYDRYFARFAKLNRYALAYENQLEPELEVLDTDIKISCFPHNNVDFVRDCVDTKQSRS